MPLIRQHFDKTSAAKVVAKDIADLIGLRSLSGKKTVLGLATGSTPLPLYAELIRLHREEGLSFKNVVTFNLDEYVGLGADHPHSYRHFMEQNLFRAIDLPKTSAHIPDGLSKDFSAECLAYEGLIKSVGGIDLQILGIGRTGHIGFNEPPSDAACRTRRVTLNAITRSDNAGFFGSPESVPTEALTMGVGTILEAKKIALLAFGAGKAEIVRRAFDEKPNVGCPATWLQLHPDCTFHLDASAHSTL